MYRIKQIPQDFIVDEVTNVEAAEKGIFSYFLLKKTGYTTQKAVERIAKALRIKAKDIGFAGTKDRNAVTTQVCSARWAGREKIEKISLKDIRAEYLGKGDEPVSLGDLKGNNFRITVRNIDREPKKIALFPNIFGEQRFSKNNADVGKAIVKKDFKKAVNILIGTGMEYEEKAMARLEKSPSDYAGALKEIPRKILMLLIHSYQSLLWNRTAEELVNDGVNENMKLPLIGFGTEFRDKKIKDIAERMMKEENISQRDFIIRQMPGLSSEGGSRELFAEIENMETGKLEDDELNKGKKKITVRFFLRKGCYATVALKSMFQH